MMLPLLGFIGADPITATLHALGVVPKMVEGMLAPAIDANGDVDWSQRVHELLGPVVAWAIGHNQKINAIAAVVEAVFRAGQALATPTPAAAPPAAAQS